MTIPIANIFDRKIYSIVDSMTPGIPEFNVVSTKIKTPRKAKAKKSQKLGKAKKQKRKIKQFLQIRCPICFNYLGNGKETVSSTGCGHVFCTGCLQRALQLKPTCPTCRKHLGRGVQGFHPLYLDSNFIEPDTDNVD